MSIIVAIAHIVGSIIALFALGFGAAALAAWELERNRKAAAEELSIVLGIPAERLDDPEHAPKVVQLIAARFSSELLRNRLSDLCGWVLKVWNWTGAALQVGVLVGVIWYVFAEDLAGAANAWWIIAIALFFWVTSMAFGLVCKVFTGRFPGQARQARKMLAEFVRTQHAEREEDEDDDDDDYYEEAEPEEEKPAG